MYFCTKMSSSFESELGQRDCKDLGKCVYLLFIVIFNKPEENVRNCEAQMKDFRWSGVKSWPVDDFFPLYCRLYDLSVLLKRYLI